MKKAMMSKRKTSETKGKIQGDNSVSKRGGEDQISERGRAREKILKGVREGLKESYQIIYILL